MAWFRRPAPTQRQLNEDTVLWARKETIKFTAWKCKVYGTIVLCGCLIAAPFFAGMPAHRYWRWIGTPIFIGTALSLVPLLYFGAMVISRLLDNPRKPN